MSSRSKMIDRVTCDLKKTKLLTASASVRELCEIKVVMEYEYNPNYVSQFVKQSLPTLLGDVKKYERRKFGSPMVKGFYQEYHLFLTVKLPQLLNGPPPPRREPPEPLELTEEEWREADEAMRRWREEEF